MKHKKIIFVCTGNTCRSPMAEAAMKQELKQRRISWYQVSSAGLKAVEGTPMSEHSKQALTEAKVPFSADFRSRLLTDKMMDDAYLIICMTESQRVALGRENATSFYALAGKEIPDPYGRGIDVYRTTLRIIRECVSRIVTTCCPKIEQKQGDKKI